MEPVVNPAIRELLAEYRKRLVAKFGQRLLELKLFGSYARGTARADSDVDVAVVLDQIEPTLSAPFPWNWLAILR